MSTRPFTGVKRLGCGADQPPLSSAEVKERVRHVCINLCAYIACKIVAFTFHLNPLTPNDTFSGRTAPLTSEVAFYILIQQI